MPDNERDRGRAYAPPPQHVLRRTLSTSTQGLASALQYAWEVARTCTYYTIRSLEKPLNPTVLTSPDVRKCEEMIQVCKGMQDYWEGKRLDALEAALEELRD